MLTKDEIEKRDKIREEITAIARKNFPVDPVFYSCHDCGTQFEMGEIFGWHWTGFTFHRYCLDYNLPDGLYYGQN